MIRMLVIIGCAALYLAVAAAAAASCVSASVLRRRRDGGIEALIEATREDMPSHVPDEWTDEFR